VIAIIITIMVLELKVPHAPNLSALKGLVPVFLSYLLSYLMVAIYWVNHHHLVHLVQKVDGAILWANVNLLFWMSLMPWVTGYLGENHTTSLATLLYSVDALACAIAFYFLQETIWCRHTGKESLHGLHVRMRRKNLIAILIYLLAVSASFIWVPASLALVALPALMYFMPDPQTERIEPKASE